MQDFTSQFFDLLLDLDENWRVDNIQANYKEKEVDIEVSYIGKQAECPSSFELCSIYDHAPARK